MKLICFHKHRQLCRCRPLRILSKFMLSLCLVQLMPLHTT